MSKGHHRNWMVRLIRWYQKHISAHTAPRCRYYPSCSNYAIQAIERFGCLKGGLLALLRLLRCNQWNRGGIDDVPQLYSLFYRCSWSKAHEEPRLTPLDVDEPIGDKENGHVMNQDQFLLDSGFWGWLYKLLYPCRVAHDADYGRIPPIHGDAGHERDRFARGSCPSCSW